MKISKLFHSLYALLMLAPVFAVGGAMAFNIFNDKAVDNAQNEDITYQEINYRYETNQVNSFSDLVSGHIYLFTFTTNSTSSNAQLLYDISGDYSKDAHIYFISTDKSTIYGDLSYMLTRNVHTVRLNNFKENNSVSFYCTVSSTTFSLNNYGYTDRSISFAMTVPDISLLHNIDYVTISACPQKYIPYTLEEVNITYPDNLSDNFYYALDSMNNSEVFSWAKTSFLAEPFSYIFGLFGIPIGSPFITLLSYWLSISIIWLVFDLVMYVPLLVHGWIDKGGIE